MQNGWQAGKNEVNLQGYKPTMSLMGTGWKDGQPTPKAKNSEALKIEEKLPESLPQTSSYAKGSVVFSEIAWMGTLAENGDDNEWIELYSNATSTIDLSGWKLEAQDKTPSIALSGLLSPGGYFLLERTDDNSVQNIPADLTYTGALKNEGETIFLKDPAGNEIDRVDKWYAGDNETKKTMQKDAMTLAGEEASNWFSAAATPKAQNQRDPLPLPIIPPPPAPTASFNFHDVVINEVMWMGTLAGADDEWLELKNASSTDISLSGWTFNIASKTTSTPKFTLTFDENDILPANGFFVLERNSSSTIQNIDGKVYTSSKSQMSNAGAYLSLADPSGNIIDSVDANNKWPAGDSEYRKSMERSLDLNSWYTFNKMGSYNSKGDNIYGRDNWSIQGTPGCANSQETQTCAWEAFPRM